MANFFNFIIKIKTPLYGCDCYAYGLLASGFCDLVVEANNKVYDFLAHIPIIEGAGGIVTDWKGNKLVNFYDNENFTIDDLVNKNTGELVNTNYNFILFYFIF